jgi:hypothetical protein
VREVAARHLAFAFEVRRIAASNNAARNARVSERLILMSLKRVLLHRIPEPSVRLFILLYVFSALVVMTFAMLDGSAHGHIMGHVQAVSHLQN